MPGFFPRGAQVLIIGQNPGQLTARESGWNDASYSESNEWTDFQQGYARGLFESPIGRWIEEGLDSVDWAFTNIIKCRTPDNSVPMPKEVEQCRPWLEQQIKEYNPYGIITLGSLAYDWWKPRISVTQARGRMLSVNRPFWNGMMLSLWHPAYLRYHHDKRTKTSLENFSTLMRFPKLYNRAKVFNQI